MSDRGAAGIYKTGPGGKATAVLVDPDRAISGITGDGKRLVYLSSQVDKLENIFLHDGGAGHPLAHVNDEFSAEVAMARWEKFTYKSNDGTDIDGWIIYPTDYQAGKQYPLMLEIHGGPHGAYGPGFNFMGQLFAARGYAVLFTNPRGSTTYGQDFTCAIDKNWGVVDYADLMAGVDAVIDRGLADPQRLFVQGWSFGGYMTCWIVTQTGRFRAACGGASVTNLLSDYGVADILWADEWEYGGQPWKDAGHLLAKSPLTHVEKVTTPLLLLHGESDMRVYTTQSDEFYAALKRLEKNVVMVRYPGEFHGLRRPLHRVDRYERTLAWFEHYNKQ
jgi:dipeptidyl aminopeptidase/acylaminoacyl peptidase